MLRALVLGIYARIICLKIDYLLASFRKSDSKNLVPSVPALLIRGVPLLADLSSLEFHC